MKKPFRLPLVPWVALALLLHGVAGLVLRLPLPAAWPRAGSAAGGGGDGGIVRIALPGDLGGNPPGRAPGGGTRPPPRPEEPGGESPPPSETPAPASTERALPAGREGASSPERRGETGEAAPPAPGPGGGGGTPAGGPPLGAPDGAPGGLLERIERAKYYPALARSQGIQGTVQLRFLIDPDGEARRVEVVEGSGSTLLDRAAVEIVHRAGPFLGGGRWVGPVLIRFQLEPQGSEDRGLR